MNEDSKLGLLMMMGNVRKLSTPLSLVLYFWLENIGSDVMTYIVGFFVACLSFGGGFAMLEVLLLSFMGGRNVKDGTALLVYSLYVVTVYAIYGVIIYWSAQ